MRRLFFSALVCVVLAGCARIPDDGTVHEVQIRTAERENAVRYSPAGPVKDATPRQIVNGFFDAMLAYPVTTTVASSFLSPDGARAWKSSGGVQIYAEPRVNAAPVDSQSDRGRAVEVSLRTEATLDAQGRYEALGSDRRFALELVKVKGQWRIDNPPKGFLVNQKFFEDYYRPFSLYFFDRPGKRLVPEPIYLPIGDQLTTSMMTALLRGPQGSLHGTARSYIPAGTELSTSLPVQRNGLVEVELKQDLIALPVAAQELLSAQIVWTLRQADGVRAVRIVADGSELSPEGDGPQTVDSWASFGPRTSGGTFFAIRDNSIVRMAGRSVAAVSGVWGKDAGGARSVAVNRSEERIATVSKGGRSLQVGGLSRDAKPVAATFSGRGFSAPVFDDRGQVWSFDRANGATRLRLFNGSEARTVPTPGLAKVAVESFALSPGQSRYALVGRTPSGPRPYVGSVLADAKDRVVALSEPRPLDVGDPDISDSVVTSPRSIVWTESGMLAFLATRSPDDVQIFGMRIDGSLFAGEGAKGGPLLPDVEATGLAVAGGQTAYVVDQKKRMWLRSGSDMWQLLGDKLLFAPMYTG